MKRFFVSVILILFIAKANSTIITWTGFAGDGKWWTAGNWSTVSIPGINDDVIFDGAIVIVEMDNLTGTYTINSLSIKNNSTVVLYRIQNGGGTRTLRIASTSSVILGLEIESGSTLTLDANNTRTDNTGGSTLFFELALTGAAGVTGEIRGSLYFKGSHTSVTNPLPPPGSYSHDGETRLNLSSGVSNYANLLVKSSGIIKYLDNSGNTVPASGTYLTMENGSTYEIARNGGSFPDADWASNSLAKVNNATGLNPPSFNGPIYGNLEWNCPNQQNYSLADDITFHNVHLINTKGGLSSFRITNSASATRTLTINGDLTISSDAKLEITGVGVGTGSGGKLHLKGNLNNQGTITTSGATGTINDFELNGTSNQSIINNGTLTGNELVLVMNGDSATLNSPLTLPGNLSMINGVIKTTSTNILRMIDGATVSGGSSSSFVEGPMKKAGDEDFEFPLGKGTMYAPIGISGTGGSASDEFTAEYVRANPQSTSPYGPAVGANLNHVSYVEYWTLDASDGVGSKKISLGLHELSFCKLLSNTYIGYWNGSVWDSLDTDIASGPNTVGNYVSGTLITDDAFDFGVQPTRYTFSFVTDLPFDNNPLPIDLISFDAKKIANNKAILNWELAACCSRNTKFEIERAEDDRRFKTIVSVDGSETDRFYSVIDNNLKTGINYYRLKMKNADGKTSYSRIEAILNGIKGLYITSLSPNPVSSKTIVSIVSDTECSVELLIIDMQGRLVRKNKQRLNTGNNTVTLLMDGLISGVYQVVGVSSDGKTNVMSLVKE